MPAPWALLRAVPDSFPAALCATKPDPPLDVARARAQHAAYRAALEGLGLETAVLPADEACPDCCFVEDTALVFDELAVLLRPGAAERRAEVDGVAAALSSRLPVLRLAGPATVDGGDCLRLGRRLFVGLSGRTNVAAVLTLVSLLAPRGVKVQPLEVPPGVLHLKSVCSPLDEETVLVAEGTLPPRSFPRARVLPVPAAEARAANVVAFGGGVLCAARAPRTADLLGHAGRRVVVVDTSELVRADGALTCLSLIWDGEDGPDRGVNASRLRAG